MGRWVRWVDRYEVHGMHSFVVLSTRRVEYSRCNAHWETIVRMHLREPWHRSLVAVVDDVSLALFLSFSIFFFLRHASTLREKKPGNYFAPFLRACKVAAACPGCLSVNNDERSSLSRPLSRRPPSVSFYFLFSSSRVY